MSSFVRNSWQVTYSSVFALIIRDIQSRFIKTVNTNRNLGFLWIILEPLLHIGIWMSLRFFMGRGLGVYTPLPYPLFILLGAVPFFFFRNILMGSRNSIKSHKNYYLFRQIKPIDPIIAKVVSELFINIFVFIVILAILSWFKVDWSLYDLQFWLLNTISFLFFLFGLSLIIAVMCFFFNFFETIINILARFSYILSGVFFNSDSLPKLAREIMLYNPVFQFIEISRECFMPPNSYISHVSSGYLFKSGVITLLFGFAFYIVFRQKMMTEIEQR